MDYRYSLQVFNPLFEGFRTWKGELSHAQTCSWLTGWDSGGFGDRLGYWQPLVSFEFSVKRCWHQNTYALHMYRCSTSKHHSLAINRSDVNAALGQSSSSPMALKVTSSSGTQARNDQKTQRFFGDVVGKWWYSPGNLRLCYWKKHAHSLDLPLF